MIQRVLSLVGILCISTLLFTDANAKGKPDHPGKSNAEVIQFVGALSGYQVVEGCCPNAGPFPEYTMELSEDFVAFLNPVLGGLLGDYYGENIIDVDVSGPLDGNLFINSYSIGKTEHGYMVQFWFNYYYLDDNPVRIFIEIRGGEIINYNRKTQELMVSFGPYNNYFSVCVGPKENCNCSLFDEYGEGLSFDLDRHPAD